MLTSWKQTRTTIEYPLHTSNRGGGSGKKKNKSRNSLAEAETSSSTPDVMGAQFVGPSYQEKDMDNKKKRKFSNENASGISGKNIRLERVEPILCLTSAHRVVFMDKGEDGIASPGNFTESKSRNYVTRPGASSQFSIIGAKNGQQLGKDGATFAGMLPPGAQYDPASNLIYAIRNGGAEVAIWTAAPSSNLPGPDDDAFGHEGSNGINVTRGRKPNVAERKRKIPQQKVAGHGGSGSLADAPMSQRLQVPNAKIAMTLTPFSIPDLAEGVAGCCEDGSIWVAIRFQTGKFEILLVGGSSVVEKAANGKNRRKSLAKPKCQENGLVVLDSRATGELERHDSKTSVLLSIQSAILPEEKSQVVFRNHQVRIHNNKSDKRTSIDIQRVKEQNVLLMGSIRKDVSAKFDVGAGSLSIVHRKNEERWLFTSVDLSSTQGVLTNSKTTFSLSSEMSGETVFSYGKVGQNVVALLMKSQSCDQPETSVMSLRIVDFLRKAELSSLCWIEGDDAGTEQRHHIFKDIRLNKMLHGKRCHGMITNELDGSIALLTTSKDDKGSLDIVFTNLDTDSIVVQSAPVPSNYTSLASALKSAATSASYPAEAYKLKGRPSTNMAEAVTGESDNNRADQSMVDEAVDQACELLATSVKELLGLTRNGKSRKGSKVNWMEVYHNSCELIVKSKSAKLNQTSSLVIGTEDYGSLMTHESANAMPKRFIEAAFKATTTVLLSLQCEGAQSKAQKNFQKTIQDAFCILVKVLQTDMISARTDYGLGLLHSGNVLISILQACPCLSVADVENGNFGKLHVINAMLKHVRDIPEGVLVSILRSVIRTVRVDDVVGYYSSAQDNSTKGARLANQYKETVDKQGDIQTRTGTRLLSQAILDFTSKVVTYSDCNQSFLTKAMRDSMNSTAEVETLLLTLAKLLKLGSGFSEDDNDSGNHPNSNQVGLSLGTIHWISALTDAHMGTLMKLTNEGGLVIDRIQLSVRSAMAQLEFANEIGEISDIIMSAMPKESACTETKSTTLSSSGDTVILPYSMERLAF